MHNSAVSPGHDRSTWRASFFARLNRYANLLRGKWWLLALCVFLGSGIQGGRVLFESPSFVSVGRMIVSPRLSIPEGSVYTEELSNFLGTQAALMQSGIVLNRARARVAAQKPDLAMKPVMLKVSVLLKTTIFVLQGTGDDPEYTQAFVQSCMEEYVNLKKEMRTQTSDTTVASLTEEVLRLEKELRKTDQELVAFQSTNSMVMMQDQGNSAGNYLFALNQRLASLTSTYDLMQKLTLDQNLERQQQPDGGFQAGSGTTVQPAPGSGEPSGSEYLKAKQQLLVLKADQQDLGQYLRPKHPKMIAMGEEIARRERLLDIFKQQNAEQFQDRKSMLAMEIQSLGKDVREWDAKTLEIQRKNAEYQRLKGNSQRIQALYDRLLATMQALDVNKEISPESVTIMEKASAGYPDQSTLTKAALIGGFAGLALGVLLLLLLDRLDDRMNSMTELQELFDEDVLAQIPQEGPRRTKGILNLTHSTNLSPSFVESCRTLRSSLLYKEETGARPKTILVTSSVPGDGKSVTVANLAITMANTGSRVLLVDADMHKGVQHQHFGIPFEPGLSEVLSRKLKWQDAVQAVNVANLFVIPRGNFVQHSGELFINEITKQVLKEAAADFDYVILDSVPVMAADDVTSLSPHVDGVVFVVRAHQTSARVVRAALDLLYHRQVRVLGLVFNAVRATSIDYHYYRYKDYYKTYPPAQTAAKR
ncbi:MAG: polysaccharide biosynthesis tyrosine autokinase [Verrucomicrobia bacterium]|jgi:capsular exopolysaccharide synthesis family protein|nr:polysaccharide biosynthesis tyrosine autokinase [Verrucomicrobiota bacterium]